jgi:hypothetical protein
MVTIDFCLQRLKEFLDREFRRQNADRSVPLNSFTFSVQHVLRGTTAVWGRSAKTNVSRGLMTTYTVILTELVRGKIKIEPYRFESFTRSRKIVYRVTRCKPSDDSE